MILRGAMASLLCLLAAIAATRTSADTETAHMADDCTSRSVSVQPLAKIVNTRDSSFDCLGVSLNARADISAIRFEKHETAPDLATGGQAAATTHVHEFTPAEIATAHGAVLDGTPGHDAVMLRGHIGAGETRVPLVLTFLYNGLTGEYRACRANLDRARDGAWHLMDEHGRPVSLVVVKTWALPVVGTVGIEALQGICAQG